MQYKNGKQMVSRALSLSLSRFHWFSSIISSLMTFTDVSILSPFWGGRWWGGMSCLQVCVIITQSGEEGLDFIIPFWGGSVNCPTVKRRHDLNCPYIQIFVPNVICSTFLQVYMDSHHIVLLKCYKIVHNLFRIWFSPYRIDI